MITLYDCATAPSPRRARILLAEKGIAHETVQRWPSILRARDAAVDVFDGRPAACLDVPSDFLELVLRFLIDGAHARVNGGPHERASVFAVPAFRI